MSATTATGARVPRSRNDTERAILDAAREALSQEPYPGLTMDSIARRAYVSRTALYFYFPSKRAIVDRLIQRAFTDMYEAASPYLDGGEDPRGELHLGLERVVATVSRHAGTLLLAAQLSGGADRLPDEWEPYISRFLVAGTARIARDQQRGVAPDDIPPGLCAQALLAMVEAHLTREVVLGGGDVTDSIRVLAELWWRAVYARPPES